MANTISLSIDISTADVGVLNDDTTFSSPARSGVGVFVSAYKVNSSSVQTAIVIEGDAEDPDTDANWTFDISTDGWYQFYYVSVPDYSAGTTYAQYDAVFDSASGEVYVSVAGGNIGQSIVDTAYWTNVSDPTSLVENIGAANESANIDAALYQRILTPKVDRLQGDKAVIVARDHCNNCEVPENVDDFELVFAIREAALISEERYEYAEGEFQIRRLDELLP